ncbi:MAG: NifU family protein, partial [Gammaproteobacteria bacterium]
PELDTLLRDVHSLEQLITDWDEGQRNTVEALTRAHDALTREAFSRLIRTLKQQPGVLDLLKQALADDVVYAVLRYHNIIKPSLQERVENALASVRPFLQGHGGDVELVNLTPPDSIEIRLLGACDGCPASNLTLSEGVEKAIRENCPEIVHIKKAKGGSNPDPADGMVVHFVSPFARGSDTGWVYAAKIDEIPENDIKVLSISGNEVLLSRFGDRVTCYQNACAHMGMPMDVGEVREGGILVCPHHGFEYSLESGECLTAPEVQLITHAVRVIDDTVEIRLS